MMKINRVLKYYYIMNLNKKKKSINQNDSIDAIAFTKITNDDIFENVNFNIFSQYNENKKSK